MIEPIPGITRHPYYTLIDRRTYLSNKEYLYINSTYAHLQSQLNNRPKYYYFDFGASTFRHGKGGSSQAWFVQVFENANISFDQIFAFEVTITAPGKVFAELPPRLLPHYHWFNVPISADPSSPMYALRFIKELARPTDYVLMKLDIDNNEVEEGIVRELLKDKVALSLVDELFWEHHVSIPEMRKYWGNIPGKYLHDSYDLFSQLRQKGIHAHFWI